MATSIAIITQFQHRRHQQRLLLAVLVTFVTPTPCLLAQRDQQQAPSHLNKRPDSHSIWPVLTELFHEAQGGRRLISFPPTSDTPRRTHSYPQSTSQSSHGKSTRARKGGRQSHQNSAALPQGQNTVTLLAVAEQHAAQKQRRAGHSSASRSRDNHKKQQQPSSSRSPRLPAHTQAQQHKHATSPRAQKTRANKRQPSSQESPRNSAAATRSHRRSTSPPASASARGRAATPARARAAFLPSNRAAHRPAAAHPAATAAPHAAASSVSHQGASTSLPRAARSAAKPPSASTAGKTRRRSPSARTSRPSPAARQRRGGTSPGGRRRKQRSTRHRSTGASGGRGGGILGREEVPVRTVLPEHSAQAQLQLAVNREGGKALGGGGTQEDEAGKGRGGGGRKESIDAKESEGGKVATKRQKEVRASSFAVTAMDVGATSGRRNGTQSTFPAYMVFPTCVNVTGDVSLTITPEDALGIPWAGWGTTLQWPGRFIGNLPSLHDRLIFLNLLFDPSQGLGLSRVRYMIPAEFNASLSPAVARHWENNYGAYEPEPGVFNFTADYGQVLAVQDAMQVAAAAGRPLHVEAISLSPPWWMTISQDAAGGLKGAPNLSPSRYSDYADHLLTLAQHFNDSFGIRLNSLAAMNEPLEMWWGAGGAHTGCSFTPEGVRQMYDVLKERRDSRGMEWLRLAGADSWPAHTLSLLTEEYQGGVPPLEYLTVHGYQTANASTMDGIEALYGQLRRAAKNVGLPIWQTEWGPMWITGNDLEVALFMGRTIAEHINILGVSAWFHFLALHYNNSVHWGAIQQPMQVPDAPLNPKKTKQFYATLHFSRYITEGSTILNMEQQCQHGVVAAYTEAEHRVAVTITNQQTQGFNVELQFNDFEPYDPLQLMVATTVVTSDEHDHVVVDMQDHFTMSLGLKVAVRPQSLTTVIISNVISSKRDSFSG